MQLYDSPPKGIRNFPDHNSTPNREVAVQTGKQEESPQYQEIKTPPRPVLPKDPFGTMKAASTQKRDYPDDLDDVFLPVTKVNDKFGTLRANDLATKQADYRENGKKSGFGYETELAVTNDLLNLLEEFRTKSYSVKEMEIMFDHWRRKASVASVNENNNKINKVIINLIL